MSTPLHGFLETPLSGPALPESPINNELDFPRVLHVFGDEQEIVLSEDTETVFLMIQ